MAFDLVSDLRNEGQEEAIRHFEGPALVIAGPGSGKTEVLIRRFVNLVLNHDVDPKSILLCTFTTKAADELTVKVLRLLEKYDYPSKPQELHIGTIHSFCNEILRDNIENIERLKDRYLRKGYRLLEEEAQLLFVHSNLERLGVDPETIKKSSWWWSENAVATFNKCTEELIKPDELLEHVDSRSEEMEEKELTKWQLLAESYYLYEKLLIDRNLVDFAHLQTFAYQLLNENKDVLKKLQDEIQFVMVDEYQDTNTIQELILKLITERGDNLVVVGDDDQSIYAFRGATIENILQFPDSYTKKDMQVKDIRLERNYRSTPSIMKICDNLIRHNKGHRFPKKLRPVKSNNKHIQPYRIRADNDKEEAELVGDMIEDMKDSKQIKEYSEVAVFFRSVANHGQSYIDHFTEKGIPFNVAGADDFFENDYVMSCNSIFRFCVGDGTDGSEHLVENEILQLNADTESVLVDAEIDFFKTSRRELQESGVRLEDIPVLMKLAEMKRNVRRGRTRSILSLFYEIMELRDVLNTLIVEQKLTALRCLGKFSNMIHEFDNNHGGRDIYTFLYYLRALDRGPNIEVPRPPIENAVTVSTIHQAKGLEFPVVILGSAIERRRHRSEFAFISPLFSRPVIDPAATEKMEERRLYYVAMSRAEEMLAFATCHKFRKTKKKREPIEFISEAYPDISKLPKITTKNRSFPKGRIRTWKKKDVKAKEVMSYSRLISYLRCPMQYQFMHQYGFSTIQIGQLQYGSNVHNAIEDIHKTCLEGAVLTDDDVEKIVRENWTSFGFRGPTMEEKFRNAATRTVMKYHKNHSKDYPRIISVEEPFMTELDNCLLRGRVDLLRSTDNDGVEIVDFKVSGESDTLDNFSRQLHLYSLAILDVVGKPPEALTIHILKDDKKMDIPFNHRKMKRMKGLVEETHSKIQDMIFPPEKGAHCSDCAYRSYCPAH